MGFDGIRTVVKVPATTITDLSWLYRQRMGGA